MTEEDCPEFEKKRALEGFCEEVCQHGVSWTVDDLDVVVFDVIGDKEMADV